LEGFSDGEATFTISISKDNRERKLLVVLTFARRLSAAKHEAYTSLVKKKYVREMLRSANATFGKCYVREMLVRQMLRSCKAKMLRSCKGGGYVLAKPKKYVREMLRS